MPTAMLPQDIQTLQSIQDLPTLVEYLRDELDWPLSADDIDDITFDYSPEELGLEQQHVVKLRNIKQLRPLVSNQPWGVFFLEFEPKKLPVVVLRRILRELVPKRRLSANASDRALWKKNDLLFVSSMGEHSHRRISFAHFRDNADGPPVLETFDWDDRETQFNSVGISLSKLQWPVNEANVDRWRDEWAAAFTKPHGYVITTSKELSTGLAELAGRVRDRVKEIYAVEQKEGPLHNLFTAFKTALVHDLKPETFADMMAQTVAYGLFTARVETGKLLGLSNLANMIPTTNPFLREMFGEIEKLDDETDSYINFDELGVSAIADLLNKAQMDSIVEDFGRQTGGGGEDPVIHFYESFLKEYDAKLRVQRGVFYTPKPIVSFIVRSVDKILRNEFGCQDGLADTSTWGDMQQRNPGLVLPKGVTPDTPFVQILDPATGTGTFLEMVIQVIWETMADKWRRERKNPGQILAAWNEYVPTHLLPRMNGFELMMASYAISHVKLGLKLKQTGYDFQSGERLRVFLTNTLEEPDELDKQTTMAGAFDFLAHESRAADAVKRGVPITIVVGNPPYSGHSANNSGWIAHLLRSDLPDGANSYFEVDGQPLDERNPKWLNDDYVKFVRFSQYLHARTNCGVLGFITNHGYLDNPTFRGMRQSLMATYSSIHLIDLHGNAKKKERSLDSGDDENVFDIQQGVAVGLFVKLPCAERDSLIRHTHLYGLRDHKYEVLTSGCADSLNQSQLTPTPSFYLFVPQDRHLAAEYEIGPKVTDIFPISTIGIVTGQDANTLAISRHEANELAANFELPESTVIPILYRPFDLRYGVYDSTVMTRPRREVMKHMLGGTNVALIFTRSISQGKPFNHVFCAQSGMLGRFFTDAACITYFAPLYLWQPNGHITANLERRFYSTVEETVAKQHNSPVEPMRQSSESNHDGPELKAMHSMFAEYHGLFAEIADSSEELNQRLDSSGVAELSLYYAYAVLHSQSYRQRYIEFLRGDFPRIPLTSNPVLLSQICRLGKELVGLHLAERTGQNIALFQGKGNAVSDAPRYVEPGKLADGGRVYIDKTQYFSPVPPEVWEFQIGGYQVCHRWLKDRKGRTLTDDDITHYGRIVAALGETIRLMGEIDEVIEEHGGWPLR